MTITGESVFISCSTGAGKKTGKTWYALKFLDQDAEVFFTCFTDKELYDAMDGQPKNIPVLLTMVLVPSIKAGRGFFELKTIEFIN